MAVQRARIKVRVSLKGLRLGLGLALGLMGNGNYIYRKRDVILFNILSHKCSVVFLY